MMKDEGSITPIIVALLVATAPQAGRLKIWILCWCFMLWGYGFLVERRGFPLPGKGVFRVLTAIGFLGVPLSYGSILGGGAFVGLLAVMAGLKPLEIKSFRDKMVTLFLAYFIVITSLFESETLIMTIYMFMSVFVTTAVMININYPSGGFKKTARLSAIIMLQAIPLMLALFLLFPRIEGSFWGITRKSSGQTGFSHRLKLGDVSDMVRNEKLAFGARFNGPIPRASLLYCRGIAFWTFNGKEWKSSFSIPRSLEKITGQDSVEYNITLEPYNGRYAFALDLPAETPRGAIMLGDNTLRLRTGLKKKMSYPLKSFTTYNTGSFKRWDNAALALPVKGNQKTRALARELADRFDDREQIINSALDYFRENNFTYTLKPQVLRKNSIDDFLFRTRSGYCEHYAASFAFLMRSAGIPARIIGGYLGGKLNPYGGYLIIRQSDAHVWVEVWLEGKGWTRVDPTYAVAPERIDLGMEDALSPEDLPDFLTSGQGGFFGSYGELMRFQWDALNARWDALFEGYSHSVQKELLSKLGIDIDSGKGLGALFLLIFILIASIGVLFSLHRLKKPATMKDPVQRIYLEFCSKLTRAGIERKPGQGPLDFRKTALIGMKDLEGKITEIIHLYITLRYGKLANDEHLKRFRLLVGKFDSGS